MNRSTAKEATDLLDIVRLTVDPATSAAVRQQLHAASSQLRTDAWRHTQSWFIDQRSRTLALLRRTSADDIDRDLMALVAELLDSAVGGRA